MENKSHPITDTIIQQMAASGLTETALSACSLAVVLRVDDESLKFHFKKRGVITNVTVRYNEGRDLYEISYARFAAGKYSAIEEKRIEEVYCDQFGQVFADILQFGAEE